MSHPLVTRWLEALPVPPRALAQGSALTVLFISSVYLAWNEKIASSSLMATFFVAIYLLTNLERLKKFSVFGLNAELRDTIKEVEATLDQLRDLALVSAKQTFFQYAMQGRLITAWKPKNDAVKEINKNLQDLGISQTRSRTIRRPIFEFASVDFTYKYAFLINYTLAMKEIDPSKFYSAIYRDDARSIADILKEVRRDDRFDIDEKANFTLISKRFSHLIRESEATGHLSDEAIEVLDTQDGPELAKLVFSQTKA